MQVASIKPGGIAEIVVRMNGKAMSFQSMISQVINNAILIAPIMVNEQTIGFSEHCQIKFLYILEGKLYLWDTISITLVRYDGDVYHKIDLVGEGKPYNRRASYRLYLGEDMPIYINTANGSATLSVLVRDISESGVSIITTEDFDIERTIRLKLKDNNSIINLSGVIVRKQFLENLSSYLYGCRFTEKNQKLGRFIATKQSDMLRRKNGLEPSLYRIPPMQKKGPLATIRK